MDEQKLYIMKNAFGLLKIGISKHPKQRVREISNTSGVPTALLIYFSCKDAYQLEQRLHKRFEKSRMSGEWFRGLTKGQIIKAIEEDVRAKAVDPVKVHTKVPHSEIKKEYDFLEYTVRRLERKVLRLKKTRFQEKFPLSEKETILVPPTISQRISQLKNKLGKG